ncbi:MAG: hypothetical protein Q9221_009099 [Calogaya cf. arnoldii]
MTETLSSAWSEVLDIEKSEINGDDSFFEIGGDSVKSMHLVGAAREKNLEIDAETIFTHPTLSGMAEHCKEVDETSHSVADPEPALNQDLLQHCARACRIDPTCIEDIVSSWYTQTDFFQSHLSAQESGAMLKQLVFNIEGTGDALSIAMAAFQAVRDKNQILRTRLAQHEGRIVQVILRDQIHWKKASDLAEYLGQDISIRTNFGDPLTRYAVVHDDSKKKTFIVWTAQHSLEDAWTRHLMLNELEDYLLSPDAYSKKAKPPSLKTYANHMASRSKDGEAFWQRYLADPPTNPRQSLWNVPENYAPGRTKWIVQQQKRISYNSHAHGGISLATVAHGAFGLAFAAMTGNLDDAVFATVRTGRRMPLEGIESIMGPLLCIIPLRIRPTFHDTIVDLLQQIHQDEISMMPYEQLARETLPPLASSLPILNWRLNGIDIFQRKIVFGTEGGSDGCVKLDAELSPPYLATFPFCVRAGASDDMISVVAGCDDGLVEESLLRRFVDRFLGILELMVQRSLKGTVKEMLVGKEVKKTEV